MNRTIRHIMVVVTIVGLATVMLIWMLTSEMTKEERMMPQSVDTVDSQVLSRSLIEVALDKWAVIPFHASSTAPVVDGRLDDVLWEQAAVMDGFHTVYRSYPVADSPSYRLGYDSETLYISGMLGAEEARAIDRIEWIIHPSQAEGHYYVIAMPIDQTSRTGTSIWSLSSLASPSMAQEQIAVQAFQYEWSELEGGDVHVEAAIPWASLGVSMPEKGDAWEMNVIHIYTLNTRPLSSWVPVHSSRYNDAGDKIIVRANVADQERWGSVFFGELPQGKGWVPAHAEFAYIGFTDKSVSFDQIQRDGRDWHYRLSWKAPDAEWEELSSDQAAEDDGRQTITFEHPAPLADGMYQLQLLAYQHVPEEGLFSIWTFDRESLIQAGVSLSGEVFPQERELKEVEKAPASEDVQHLLALLPEVNGFTGAVLPEHPDWTSQTSFVLSDDGTQLLSIVDGTAYPNAMYPETHTLEVTNKQGRTVVYPYYEDEGGRRYFFSALKWRWQMVRVLASISNLKVADPLGSARLLYAFTKRYEGYVPVTTRPFHHYPTAPSSGPPYNYFSSYLGNAVGQETTVVRKILEDYSQIANTNAFQILSEEVGEDVEARIIHNLFLPALDYSLGFPIAYTNYDPYFWRTLSTAGRVLNRPDYIHLAVEWIKRFMTTQFMSDGFWHEITLSYHQQVWNNLNQAFKVLQGYSDPPGYVSPRDGMRYDQLNLYEQMPILARISQLRDQLTYPDRRLLPIEDTWANTQVGTLAKLDSLLMPASGIGRLALGTGSAQWQLGLMFTPKYGHNQLDPLNLTLYAEGQELLPDLGYTYTRYKQYSKSTMSHNTVVVNGADMLLNSTSEHGGHIERFVDGGELFQSMRADEESAYPQTDLYNRESWLVPLEGADGNDAYVLDIFRVTGGDRHEYLLQGDANRDAVFRTNMRLTDAGPYLLPEGTQVQIPQHYNDFGSADDQYPGYIYVRDVKLAELTDDQYQLTLVTQDDSGEEQAKLRITGLLEDGNHELYLGRSPSIRATRLYGGGGGGPYDNNIEADKYDLPKLVLRREGNGDGQLTSTFVTVLEPYRDTGVPRLATIEKLPPDQPVEGAVAVKVTYGDTTDILLSNPLHPDRPFAIGNIVLHGEMGLIRLQGSAAAKLQLAAGTRLEWGDTVLESEGTLTGKVTGTMRVMNGDAFDAVVIDSPVRDEVVGRYVIVTHPDQSTSGFKIGAVRNEQGKTMLVLAEQDPGFDIDSHGASRQSYYPGKQWQGEHTYSIANVTTQSYGQVDGRK